MRHRRMLAPIVSRKHLVDIAPASIASGSSVPLVVAVAVDQPVNTSPTQVEIGSVIKAVYIECWVSGVTANQSASIAFYKRPAGVGAMNNGDLTSGMNQYDNKANILEFHKGLGSTEGSIIPMFRHWVAIPKGKQRMAAGDSWTLSLAGSGTTVNFCGLMIFKEYR